jgi:hypothetical protein
MAKHKPSPKSGGDGDIPLRPRSSSPHPRAEWLRAAATTGASGRYLVIFRSGASAKGVQTLHDKAGLKIASTADSPSGAISHEELGDRQLLLDELDIAVVEMEPDQFRGVASASDDSAIELVVPESIKYAAVVGQPMGMAPGVALPAWPVTGLPNGGVPGDHLGGYLDYVRGYLDGAALARLLPGYAAVPSLGFAAPAFPMAHPIAAPPVTAATLGTARGPMAAGLLSLGPFGLPITPGLSPAVTAASSFNETQLGHTWGLEVTEVIGSEYSGQGVKVAVLDTGFDFNHPDFEGRPVTSNSFVSGFSNAQDGHGHGTHCTGTACGPRDAAGSIRYGIAYEADIFIGKVLGDDGSGLDGDILHGINWAVKQGCRVISISIQGRPEHGPEWVAYEKAAKAALKTTAIIAAAGNHSNRQSGIIRPVSTPANCPSILAVAAVSAQLKMADFSDAGSVDGGGGAIGVAGPGVDVYSSWPLPQKYARLQGTSQATPHVAGIAALIAQARPNFSGADILNALLKMAEDADRVPNLSVDDVGSGLVVAP